MDIDKNITKKSDIHNNDSLSIFMGGAAQQHHNAYQVFYDFIRETKPARILEIGTAQGGFTQFLKLCCDDLELKTNIRSYDIHTLPWYWTMIAKGIDVKVENVFYDNYASVKQDIIDYIQQDGVTIVLCDGGNKIGEFNLLSKYLKIGDFIMAHDYVYDSETFANNFQNIIWNWHEISNKDIETACQKNNLIPYNEDAFNNVVWTCKQKQK